MRQFFNIATRVNATTYEASVTRYNTTLFLAPSEFKMAVIWQVSDCRNSSRECPALEESPWILLLSYTIHIHFRLLLTRTWTLMLTWWWLAPRTAKHVYPWRVCIFCVWKQQVHVVSTVFQWPSSSYIGRNQSMPPHAASIPAFSHSCLYRKHYFKFSISVQYSIFMKTIE